MEALEHTSFIATTLLFLLSAYCLTAETAEAGSKDKQWRLTQCDTVVA
jgi:hypothetical protein